MQDFVAQYLIQIIFGIVSTCLGLLCKHLYSKLRKLNEESEKRVAERDKEDKLTREGVLVTLHMRLYELCQRCIDKGTVTTEELKNTEDVYNIYHALGGNGTGSALYNRILKLPIDNDRKED